MVKNFNNIKTTDTSDLVKRADSNTKIGEIEKKILDHDHGEYITTQEFHKLMTDSFVARLKQANVASKNDIAHFVQKTNFNEKLKNCNKKLL